MKKLMFLGVVVLGLLAVFLLSSCESPAAQRARARAEEAMAEAALLIAEAKSYSIQRQADIDAANAAEDRRQARLDAAYQRAMLLMPFVAMIVGGVLLFGLALFMFWDLRSQAAAAKRDEDLWNAVRELSVRVERINDRD